MGTYILYHGNCADGFASAYVIWKYFTRTGTYMDAVRFLPVQYDEPLPDLGHNNLIYIVDFCYSEETIRGLAKNHHKVIILDHHISHKETLMKDYPSNVKVRFDLSKSGVGLTLDYFNFEWPRGSTGQPPQVLYNIQDRDIWTWELSMTKEITAGLDSYERTFEQWDKVIWDVENLLDRGHDIVATEKHQVESICNAAKLVDFEGHKVPVVIMTVPRLHSAVGAQLIKDYNSPFSIVLRPVYGKKIVSMRSDGFDVATIAEKWGGGGHNSAASFKNDDVFDELLVQYFLLNKG